MLLIHASIRKFKLESVCDIIGLDDQIILKVPAPSLMGAFRLPTLSERKAQFSDLLAVQSRRASLSAWTPLHIAIYYN